MIFVFNTAAVLIGVLLDLILGDPESWPHPVRFMGGLVKELEEAFRSRIADNSREKRRAGFFIWLIVASASVLVPAVILFIAWKISPHLYVVIASVMCYQLMAVKNLKDESLMVKKMLDQDDIYLARIRLSRIVGRDTEGLDEEHVIRAAVETVAENTCDGCIAPLFYMALFGPVGGFFYKAVNTMDSMLGYKNEKYIDLGAFAARADDVMSFIPARISALLLMLSAMMPSLSFSRAVKIYIRDRKKSSSPNSGQCESVVAGALGIELLGDAVYFGEKVEKPVIGDRTREAVSGDIEKADDMLYLAVILAVVLTLAGRFLWAMTMGLL